MKAWEDGPITIIAYGLAIGVAIAAVIAGFAAGFYTLTMVLK